MTEQPDLFDVQPRSNNPLCQYMVDRCIHGWATAQMIYRSHGKAFFPHQPACSRQLREWAEESNGRIISGNKGYRLIEHATPEERKHAARRLISQGKKMTRRGIKIMRRAHQIEGG